MSSLINKAKAALHSDKDKHDNAHGHNTASTYDNTTTGGAYNTTSTGGYDNPRSTNEGPHGSNMMNKMDPRVDSDRDNRNDPTSRVGGYGTQEGYGAQGANPNPSSGGMGHNTYGTTGGIGSTGGYDNTGYNSGSTNLGPHNSNMMNKMDPRVDSDGDDRNNPTSRVGGYGANDNYGAGPAGVSGTTGHHGGHNAGVVGGDNYGRDNTFHDSTTTGGYGATSGAGYNSGATHGSHAHGHNTHPNDSSYTPGSGNAEKTAGPHNSNLLNKLDPRVDSDADGSKTYGGNKTYQ